jgi:hypothetical protein
VRVQAAGALQISFCSSCGTRIRRLFERFPQRAIEPAMSASASALRLNRSHEHGGVAPAAFHPRISFAEHSMHSIAYTTLDEEVRYLPSSDIDTFAALISGGVLKVGDAAYDKARMVWNATVDRRPTLIARCLIDSDVQAAVRFAAAHRMLLSVRGGGHHIAGNAVAEGGLMIDLSGIRAISIDPAKRTARVGPGALLGDLDRESQAHGLATPLGINSTTGVAGLTLGGGFGCLRAALAMVMLEAVGLACYSLHRITSFAPSRSARAPHACVLAAVFEP